MCCFLVIIYILVCYIINLNINYFSEYFFFYESIYNLINYFLLIDLEDDNIVDGLVFLIC